MGLREELAWWTRATSPGGGSRKGREHASRLRAMPMFAHCAPAELQVLDLLLCETRVAPGRVLIRQGRPADQMVVVMAGRARVSSWGETLGAVEAGTCIGGREIRDRLRSEVTITAETGMTVRAAGAREALSLVSELPHVDFAASPPILRALSSRPSTLAPLRCTNLVGATVGQSEVLADVLRSTFCAHGGNVLATLLFTHIVDSAPGVPRVGPATGAAAAKLDALFACEQIVDRQVRRYNGVVISAPGEGTVARFASAYGAVRCVLAIRQDVRELGLDVRAGLHVGDVERCEDHDGGQAVCVANQICSAAGPGQVLASGAVGALVAGSGLTFEDAGTRALPDVAGEWRLLALAT